MKQASSRPRVNLQTVVSLILAAVGMIPFPGRAGETNAAPAAPATAPVASVRICTLPRMSLAGFGTPAVTEAVLQRAKRNGLKYTDLPSIGSGIARTGENEFVGITDRGPNAVGDAGDDAAVSHRTFPLPEFCPSIVRFKLAGDAIQLTEIIPLHDHQGRLATGLSNRKDEEQLYDSPGAAAPLAPDPDGVDPEGIRVLPDGNFILVEEYSPSIFIVSPKGEVLMRYTPVSKPLTGATYPVKAILPEVLTRRRPNHGFESIAVSPDGKFAWAIMQSPLGDAKDGRYQDSRVIRVVKLDLGKPLDARVAGEYVMLTSPAGDYGAKQKQEKVALKDAEWIGPDKLLVLERGKSAVKLLAVDFQGATDVLRHPKAADLTFEDTATDLAALGVKPARPTEVLSTAQIPQIDTFKLEGLAVIGPGEIALANDNDFGIGDNVNGEPSKVWVVKFNLPW